MFANTPKTTVVDERSPVTNFAVTMPTTNHEVGRQNSLTHYISPEHLLASIGVKTADLIGTDVSFDVHPPQTAQPTNAHYGIMFHTGKDRDKHLNTSHRSVAVDASTGESFAYHYVHVPHSGFGKVNLSVRPEKAATEAAANDDMLAWKRCHRWLAEPPDGNKPFKLLKPEHVDAGVTKAELNGVTKYIVTPKSAVHRLITNSHGLDSPESFMEGKYTAKNVKTANVDGATGYVVEEGHYNKAAQTLKQQLDMATAHPLGEGISLTVEKLSEATNPSSITIPFTIHRTPLAPPHGSDAHAAVTVADVEHALASTAIGKAAAPSSLEASAFDAKTPGQKATLTPLVSIAEAN